MPYTNLELNDLDYIRFRDLILERSGLYFPEHKRIDLTTGLSQALSQSPSAANKAGFDLNTYYNLLRNNSRQGEEELNRLINILTIGETYFFRDEAQFDALAYHVLPEIVERKRAIATAFNPLGIPQLRIWSAGCASGEEPYSIAMILKEFIPDIDKWQISILGTDINQNVLEKAKKAHYSNWSFREARAKALRSRYFTHVQGEHYYRLNDEIQKMVMFQRLNLIEDNYPSVYNNTYSLDLIFCRNVTIYFPLNVTQQVIQRFYECLAQNGWLIVGHAESSLTTYRSFEAKTFPSAIIYQKTGQISPWPEIWEKNRLDKVSVAPSLSQPLSKPQPIATTLAPSTPKKIDLTSRNNFGTISPPPTPLKPLFISPSVGGKPEASKTKMTPLENQQSFERGKALLEQGEVDQAVEQLKYKIAIDPKFAPAYSLLGRAYANMGRWSEAKYWCEQAVELDPLLAEPYYMLALVYQNENRVELAITNLKKATYLDHNAPLPYFQLAMLYKKIGDREQAKRFFQVAIKILQKMPTHQVIPESGGGTAQRLLDISRRILTEL